MKGNKRELSPQEREHVEFLEGFDEVCRAHNPAKAAIRSTRGRLFPARVAYLEEDGTPRYS